MGSHKKNVSDTDFQRIFMEHGAERTAVILGRTVRNVYRRRERLEAELGYQIKSPNGNPNITTRQADPHPHRIMLEIQNGVALIGSDAHYWPGPISTGHRAFVHFIRKRAEEKRLKAVVLNGDALDFPQISRHPPIGWDELPTVQDEVENAQERLGEIEEAGGGTELAWNLGNHDARFETRLATVAPEFARMAGFSLKDHFPLWQPGWSTWINNDVVIKHRFRGGMYAPQNNTLWSGKTTVTGHLHSAKVMPITDYNGTRYGVDSGCIANVNAAAFVDYTEDNPKNWRSAFCELTFIDGKLLQPELILVWDENTVQYRGELIHV
jgi:hypothetical protein